MGQEFVRTFSEQFEDPNVEKVEKEGSYVLYSDKVENSSQNTQAFQNHVCRHESENDENEGMDIRADIAAMEDFLLKKHDKVPKQSALIDRIRNTNHKIMNTVRLSGFGITSRKPKSIININTKNSSNMRPEALAFMRGVMDECTHLGNYSIPVDTDLIIIIAALHDAYVIRKDVLSLDRIWPGAQVRYVDSGHVGAFVLHTNQFRQVHKLICPYIIVKPRPSAKT